MFKIPSKESQLQLVESYKTLAANAVKVHAAIPCSPSSAFHLLQFSLAVLATT
jgi:hypothetical protein